jgi:hypothetical protein
MRPGVCLTAVFVAGFFAQGAPLGAAELRGDVSKLLALGEKHDAAAVAAARDRYALLKQSHPNDPRIDYAYGLVLLNQRDHARALPLIDRYVRSNGADLEAARVKLWAQLQNRHDEDVLAAAVGIAERLPKDAAGQDAAECAATAGFLGSVFGYLERARVAAVDRKLKSQRTNELLAALGDAYLPAFDEGRSRIADRLAEMRQKQQAAERERSLSAEKRQQQIDAALEEGEALIAEKRQAVDASSEGLQEARRRLSDVGRQLSALSEDRARVGGQILAAQAELTQIQSTTNSQTVTDPSVSDPNDKQRLRVDTALALPLNRNAQAQYLAAVLGVLNKKAFDLDRRIVALRAEAATAMVSGRQETRSLVASTGAIRKAEKRTAALEKAARRMDAKPSAPAGRLTVQMTRLSTYLPLPYAEESKRVLSWFEK